MSAPALTAAERAKLAALMASPIADEMAARLEAERASRRRAVIEAMQADEAKARAKAEAVSAQARTQRGEVARLHAAHIGARIKLLALEGEAERFTEAAERAVTRAGVELEALGGAAIDATIMRCRIAERESRGLIAFRETADSWGRRGFHEVDPSHALRAQRMLELVGELERLRFDTGATPGSIEARCREIEAEINATAPTLPAAARRGERVAPPAV